MSYALTTLPSGLKVATETLPGVETVSVAVTVSVGARYETEGEGGISHLLEHMAFKGTERRSALTIAEEMDNIGAHLNAYTSLENTVYYAKVMKRDMALAVDLLADILQHSVFDNEELIREKQVILQEIGMHFDSPEDLVFDYFHEATYPAQPLGRSILGTEESVSSFTREQIAGYMGRHYQPLRMAITAAGALEHGDFLREVEQKFQMKETQPRIAPRVGRYEGGDLRRDRELEQLHLMMGLEGVAIHDPDYYALHILSIILGGSMSSRLFQEVREKRGLAYTVQAFMTSYADTGVLAIHAATGGDQAGELVPVICDELLKLTHGVSDAELRRGKNQYAASLMMSRESTSSVAEWIGRHLLVHGRYIPAPEIIERIEAVTHEDVVRVAGRVLAQGRPTIAALGPLDTLESYEKTLERLKR